MSETYETRGPRCPYCQHLHRDLEAFHYNEGLDEMQCESCERDFGVRVYTSTSWTCATKEPAQ